MGNLVRIENGVPVVSTLDMWEELEVEHIALIRLIKRYEDKFQSIKTFSFSKAKSSGGRRTEYALLNEEQVAVLVTLMRNSDVTVPFKFKLGREFYRMKNELIRIASQNQNAQWLETRKAGKETRRIATDTIERFIDYAKEQGSKNAGRYYANISNMENKALFLLEQKYKNLRDALDIHQLSTVKAADTIVVKSLLDGMERGLHYKDIYEYAKQQIESFAGLIGKTLIPSSQLRINSPKLLSDGGQLKLDCAVYNNYNQNTRTSCAK